ncbi:lactonase family protein [Microbacterium sp. EYE_5]|uniref:lactonase family protein n=1 Tax=unclassified Microbacterium TaxID=2609290 RepID=UPI002006D659|nr:MULTISPECIES: beta-propeller fold lactonase family protein [unclassified Microbacterium]MCK6080228.1 lactonase family protein [Microbacterium sp. EYE_382]MCK6085499.1 lactonase family protein [Microbacterium sp. EYE_384]MCK6122276.1 lactonase family protein [Microbacterium sp. EYE_80]MCK6126262.1 lactonase family protein [Microbacterium sp. EYE_79]MCK6141183.1 lactonase family protein [Microbacterium sp. EYE_39]
MSSSLVLVANAGDSSISTFRLTDGALERLAVTTGITGCSNFAVDVDRGLVYASVKRDDEHPDAGILTLSLDRETGELTPRSRRALPGGAMNYLALTRDGAALLGAAYAGGYGIVCAVGDDGAVSDPVSEVRFPRLHSVLASADGRFAYFVSLEADVIAQYRVEDDLTLAPLDPEVVAAPEGSGPRHLAFADDESAVYVLTEFTGEVLQYARDPQTGGLELRSSTPAHDPSEKLRHSVIDEDPRENHYVWGADIHLSEGVVWASERTASTLAALAVREDGSLTPPAGFVPTETQPRGFAISPDRTALVAAGERSTTVTAYRIAGAELERTDRAETGRGANWVRFA